MAGRKSSMFRKSADRALIGEVNYSLRFCPTYVCNLPVVQGQDGLWRVWESEFWAENKGGPLSPYSE
jgi:hypothetical protein